LGRVEAGQPSITEDTTFPVLSKQKSGSEQSAGRIDGLQRAGLADFWMPAAAVVGQEADQASIRSIEA
jgi:ABC-type xylose transport system substrate-binding protein